MDFLLKVARLYYEEHMNQQEIAKHLNISRVKVYRMLMKAREEGIVKIELHAPPQDFSELEIKLERNFGLKQCIILPTSDSMEILYSGFGNALNSVIDRYFKKGMKIGVGWGRTIKGTVEKMTATQEYSMKIFPAIGGSGLISNDIHANAIVSSLSSKLGATGYILNCPAILDSQASKEIFLKESIIKKIVDQFESLDLVIVPIGYIDSDITIYKTKEITVEDIDYLKSLGVVGDINSNFIDVNGNLVPNKIQDRIINVSIESLKKIKNTVAICNGEKKICATRAALKSGVINTLITDTSIAKKLLLP
ncbi:sugar-binding transcriptional regulator [Desulfosporosinus youngiae]|uniref:Transcriptional regulator with sigma factor-related N-terminal domain n=1 Tax=Desulfosporosinus youngiae DSM 17734 TaxID=768710 RepID=H5Y0F9_9FIRM|nr:sugar-binding transcriptional regulator [Desulfosporosinus youngiae]EHQ92215.1 transcriptional regulator with sigma factor-related N-terminal domain [Desulfosporosinus youngiae DSM 17734]